MNPQDLSQPADTEIPSPAKRSLWQKLGGGSLSISLFLHLALLAIGVIWVLKVIPADQEKVIEFSGNSGAVCQAASEAKTAKQRARMLEPIHRRRYPICGGEEGRILLPEPDENSQMVSLGALASGGSISGLGGGGHGPGAGPGIGSGVFGGMTDGTGNKNPFGALTLDPKALAGTFYDFKQTRTGKPTELEVAEVQTVINDFVNHGWKDSTLRKYYQAPRMLYQSKLYIPLMDADAAPAAFECADEVQPGRWAVVYRGVVSPPHSGKFRFVGSGDDILVVRFNGKNVFDHGYYSGTVPMRISSKIPAMKGEVEDTQVQRLLRRDYPMEQPLKTYTYSTTRNFNSSVGGLGVGPVFEAEAGKEYPIDILLSELPGGKFCAALLIEEVGAKTDETKGESPVLPLFRLDNNLPDATTADNAPPYDPNGSVWKIISGRGTPDF